MPSFCPRDMTPYSIARRDGTTFAGQRDPHSPGPHISRPRWYAWYTVQVYFILLRTLGVLTTSVLRIRFASPPQLTPHVNRQDNHMHRTFRSPCSHSPERQTLTSTFRGRATGTARLTFIIVANANTSEEPSAICFGRPGRRSSPE